MKKKTLKLSLETVRHLEGVTGGAMSEPMPSRFGACPGTNRTHSLNRSCGIVCTFGPERPTRTRPSVGIICL